MPSDANGVFSLVDGYLAVTGETIQASQHNPPLEDIATGITARLMRSGVAPMTGSLKIVDGSVGAPAVQFSNGATTGLYKTTNGIGVSINGTKVAEFTSGGLVSGGHFLGELIPWTRLTAPALTVLPYGQTLSRTTYADLWTVAQDEIAAGNTFYNNGNGTTTFGIGDTRGRGVAGKDDMGGTAAGRLTATYFGTAATVLGAVGGLESHTLTTAQLASHQHNAFISDPGHSHTYTILQGGIRQDGTAAATVNTTFVGSTTGASATGVRVWDGINLDRTSLAGGGGAHNNVQPTIITNYILFAGA